MDDKKGYDASDSNRQKDKLVDEADKPESGDIDEHTDKHRDVKECKQLDESGIDVNAFGSKGSENDHPDRGFKELFSCTRKQKEHKDDDAAYGFRSRTQLETKTEKKKTKSSSNIDEQHYDAASNASMAPSLHSVIQPQTQASNRDFVENVAKSHGVPLIKTAPTDSRISTKRYNFNHTHRGYMVLIINKNFKKETERIGADNDLKNMKAVAEKLKLKLFDETRMTNLNQTDTNKLLDDAQKADHSQCDTFVFVISTHGSEEANPAANGQTDLALICADDKYVFASSIMERFNNENCPLLKNKPKIFIMQACRGDAVDDGNLVDIISKTKHENPTSKAEDKLDANPAPDSWAPDRSMPSLKCTNDMLVMYAIPPGFTALRNERDGSWMIYYMHECIVKENVSPHQTNFLTLLTKVSGKMAKRSTNTRFKHSHNKTAVPVIEHKLMKDVFFSN